MAKVPTRLHHSAVVARDLAASREFYEGIMGLPLMATWRLQALKKHRMRFEAERTPQALKIEPLITATACRSI